MQEELVTINKLLGKLAIVDAGLYKSRADDLYHFLETLRADKTDYGSEQTYQAIVHSLEIITNMVRNDLAMYKDKIEQIKLNEKRQEIQKTNPRTAQVYKFTPILNHPKYEARYIHLLMGDEIITLKKSVGDYFQIQSGTWKGYIHNSMIR
ncbi:hypothetical protein J2I47_07375 [Fibrella sp. HMF5335]|uniref:Uncharacterized protein n=1 Tax=Fibrella rubiginis TaxID=2817060 RepID=A0A939GF61_9BACT|nr:hypothetical protein [Fibrella rubiginis]MBO0936365.1 hypothetical protein [Fibrella rubiginis]